MEGNLANYKLKSELSVLDIIGHAIIWIILCVLTLGLGFFVFPYYMVRFIINKTSVVDKKTGYTVGKLECNIDLASVIGYIILWTILTIVTCGLLYFVFLYKITAHCLNKTTIAKVE